MKEIQNIIYMLRNKFSHNSAAEMSWVVVGQIVSVVLGFILLKILSSLGNEDFGIYALVITLTVLFGLLFYGPIQQGFLRFYYSYVDKHLSTVFVKFFYKVLFISGIIFLALIVTFYIFSFSFEFNQPSLLFLTAGIFIISFKIDEFFNSLLNLLRKRKENAFLQGIEKSVTICLLLLLAYINELKLVSVFIGMVLITTVFAAIKINLFNKYLPDENPISAQELKPLNKKIKKELIVYISPFLIWGIGAWLQLNGEKWIINGYLTISDVGIYAIMMALVNALIVIPSNIVSEISLPLIFKQYADLNKTENITEGGNYIKINIIFVAVITFFACGITYLLGEELIVLVSDKSYAMFWYLLPLLCLGYGLFLTGQAQTTLGLALNLPQKYLWPKIGTGILSVGLNFLFIKHLGIKGVAYTSVIVGIFYVLYISVVNKRIQNKLVIKSK